MHSEDVQYVEHSKNSTDELCPKQKQRHRHRGQTYGYQGWGEKSGMNWESVIDIYTLLCMK